jgi:hypothetical protein
MTAPAGAIVSRADIESRKLLQDKPEGEPFLTRDLGPAATPPTLSSTVPVGRLLATLQIGSMDLPVPELFAGDRLEILQATPEGVRIVAHDAQVMGTLKRDAPAETGDTGRIMGIDIRPPDINPKPTTGNLALVLAVYPADVYGLTAAEASGKKLKVVLHSDQEVKSGKLIDLRPLPAPPPVRELPLPSVELLMGDKIERVTFR